jgi:hypothetical protein
MWALETFGIAFNPADNSVGMPLWAAGAAAVLLVLFLILALVRSGLAGTLTFVALAGFGIWAALAWNDHQRGQQRAALEQRVAVLNASAVAPNSPLACLDVGVGDLAEPCEKAVFGAADSAAAAATLTAARVNLLKDGLALAGRDPAVEAGLEHLRTSLEADRYGAVAFVLSTYNGCTAEACEPLRLFRDSARIQANLRARTFENAIARHASDWNIRTTASGTSSTSPPGPGMVATPISPRYSLPSAASIPPVSIMSAEPTASTPPGAEPQTTAATPPQTPAPRRPVRSTPVRQPAAAAAPPPVQLAPPPPTPARP